MRSLLRVVTGLVVACLVAGASHGIFAALSPLDSRIAPPLSVAPWELALLTATHFFLFSAPFAVIATIFAEWLAIRSLGFYLSVALAIAFAGFAAQYINDGPDRSILNDYAIRAFLTAGFLGGFVYWLIAGQSAGRVAAPAELKPPPFSPVQG